VPPLGFPEDSSIALQIDMQQDGHTLLVTVDNEALRICRPAKYNINLDRLRKYLPAPSPRLEVVLYIGFVLLAVGGFYLFNWVLVAWLERKAKKDRDPR
jgi:hypothetical protein